MKVKRRQGDIFSYWATYKLKLREKGEIIFPLKLDERNLASLMPVTPDTIEIRLSNVPKISDNVPKEIKERIERLIKIYKLTPFEYELHSVVVELAYPTYESALRFAYWFNLPPKGMSKNIKLKKKGETKEVDEPKTLFEALYKGWRLSEKPKWRGTFLDLVEWAINEGKIKSLKLKQLRATWELRNYNAHPMFNTLHWLTKSINEITRLVKFCNELFEE